MSSELIAQLSPASILILLLAREVLSHFKSKKKTTEPQASKAINTNTKACINMSMKLERIEKQIDELKKMHEIRDNTGRPVWYCSQAGKHD